MKKAIRKIIHIDMDAFFASVEQRDFPQYRNKPLAVGGITKRGVVAAASYEARKFGIHSAMPSKLAIQKCPHIIFVKPRFDVYKMVSRQILEIFKEYTDLVEPLSIDEAYLDVTSNKRNMPSAMLIAKEIKHRIKNETQLTASAGISVNKFLAKVASGMNKPDGLTVIEPDEVDDFIKSLPIEKFFGVGKVTAAKMKKIGIKTGSDLFKFEEIDLVKIFGKAGLYYYKIARGEDNREVKPDRIRKSIGTEKTFENDLSDKTVIIEELGRISKDVINRMHRAKTIGKTITLKIKYHDFIIKTRCKSLDHDVLSCDELFGVARNLLNSHDLPDKAIRLLGISVSNLNTTKLQIECGCQLTLEF